MIPAILIGYAVGSLPIGYFVARTRGGVDLRRVGSGNVGTANVYRTAGLTIGTPVLFSSVAHGSALDIAGKNQADASAMIEAIRRLAGATAPGHRAC